MAGSISLIQCMFDSELKNVHWFGPDGKHEKNFEIKLDLDEFLLEDEDSDDDFGDEIQHKMILKTHGN